jgi:tripartite ATP-independent transporter DctM subunit
MIAVLFLSFAVLLAAGVPVAFGIGLSALLVILTEPSLSLPVMITKTFAGMDSFPMMAIPFFILAGEIMGRSGLTDRIVAFASSLVGHIRGGLAHVNIIANMIMAGVSGSAAADCSATGSILIPAMVREGYRRDFSALVTAFAATMGPMIPPSIFMIIYGTIAGVSVGALFLGGIVPGVMIGLFLMVLVVILTRGASYAVPKGRFAWGTVWKTAREAVWALIMPLIVVGGILGGLMTPTEAGIIAVVYSILVGVWFHRELTWNALREIVKDGAIASANIMLVVGFAAVFGNILTLARFDEIILRFLLQTTSSPSLIMAEIILALLVIGGIMDEIATAFMFVPSLAAIGAKLGYDPVHFGVVMVLAILLGAVVPPVATLLFIGCSLAKITLSAVMRLVWIFLLPLLLVTFLIAYIPPLVTAIPRLFFR